jgi:DNA topoisomerase-1
MLRETGNEEQVLDRTAEVAASIAEEGLRYVSDSAPGYTRKRTGTTFSYYDKDGKRITDAAVIRRIKSIGIPPAYESVWICPLGQRPHPGDRARCEGPQAVSLSPEVAGTP